jgi:hypothetical protein
MSISGVGMDMPFQICVNFNTFYIKKNRELTKEDFIPLTSKANSILFITEDDWEELEFPTIQSKKPSFQKRYCLQLRWLNDLEKSLDSFKGEAVGNMQPVKDLISLVRCSSNHYLSLPFNWKGCPLNKDKERKLERKRKEFEELFKTKSPDRESFIVNLFTESINKKIDHINERYVGDVFNSIKNNLNSCVPESDPQLEKEASVYVDEMQLLNNQLAKVRKELNEIRLKQKALKLTTVQKWFKEQPLPQDLKEKLIENFEQEKTKSDARPFLTEI